MNISTVEREGWYLSGQRSQHVPRILLKGSDRGLGRLQDRHWILSALSSPNYRSRSPGESLEQTARQLQPQCVPPCRLFVLDILALIPAVSELTMNALTYTFFPVFAVVLGAVVALARAPSAAFTSAMQHLAAGVVFAAAATEILPQILHGAAPTATFIGGACGVAVMLLLKSMEARAKGPLAMLTATGIDIFIDGLVLGLSFIAGAQAGLLLTIALTLEVLFLGVTLTAEMRETIASNVRIGLIIFALALLLPLGALVAAPVGQLPPNVITAFLAFGLMALLYLVTEELLVEAHEKPDSPLITAMFFVGFLGLVLLEEIGSSRKSDLP